GPSLGVAPGAAAVAAAGGSPGFSLPGLPVRAEAAAAGAAAAEAAPAPARALPRKVSLRFAPRDGSTEGKLSKHGYLPYQKLTAPLWKPLEAVFKFMAKKWSDVADSDLNSIRIVFDVVAPKTAGKRTAAVTPAAPPSSQGRTIVWSEEHSKTPLADLVNSLPSSALDRVRDEEVLDLTYTFSMGSV
ncbi:unnamed protein product, partial [Scytosiphon promiscuus]